MLFEWSVADFVVRVSNWVQALASYFAAVRGIAAARLDSAHGWPMAEVMMFEMQP